VSNRPKNWYEAMGKDPPLQELDSFKRMRDRDFARSVEADHRMTNGWWQAESIKSEAYKHKFQPHDGVYRLIREGATTYSINDGSIAVFFETNEDKMPSFVYVEGDSFNRTWFRPATVPEVALFLAQTELP